jgi:hypothetical protein
MVSIKLTYYCLKLIDMPLFIMQLYVYKQLLWMFLIQKDEVPVACIDGPGLQRRNNHLFRF